MPLAVTCQCGARLEIDEKFLGKEVPCPDCRRPLPTTPPPSPPPLDLPDNRRVSGLAVLSLALALVGAITIVGTLAAIAVGVFALRQIGRQPSKLEGVGFARAGIIVGAVFTFLTLAALISPTTFGLDSALRQLIWAGQTKEAGDPITIQANTSEISLKRPSTGVWMIATTAPKGGANLQGDEAMSVNALVVNARDDAYIACFSVPVGLGENAEEREKKVLAQFHKSGLVNLLNGNPPSATGAVSDRKAVPGKNDWQEMIVDLRLRGIDRRFLVQYSTRDIVKAIILVGGARKRDFERVQEQFREAFKDFKIQ